MARKLKYQLTKNTFVDNDTVSTVMYLKTQIHHKSIYSYFYAVLQNSNMM